MAQYDGSIKIDTSIDTRGLRKGENDIRASAERISNSLKRMVTVIASAFAVEKLARFGKEALQVASDFEAMEAKFLEISRPRHLKAYLS